MPVQKSAKSPKSAAAPAAKAISKSAAPASAKAVAAPSAAGAAANKTKTVPVKSSAELIKAADELLKKKPARAKAAPAADAAGDDEAAPKKRPGRPAKAAGTAAAAKTPAKRGRKPKAAADSDVADDADLSDIEADLEGEVEAEPEAAAAAPAEKVKPLRMKISKAKERALMKEFGLDETVLSEEDLAKRRSRLKTLITLGKTRGYLTQVEISDHLPTSWSMPRPWKSWSRCSTTSAWPSTNRRPTPRRCC